MAGKKVLNKSDIMQRAERWATAQKQLVELEAEREKALEPAKKAYAKRVGPINKEFDAKIAPIEARSEALEIEITEWLDKQTKSVEIESKSAIAKRSIGEKLGNRIVDAAKFMKLAAKRKIDDYMSYVHVSIKDAESVFGKEDMATVCTTPRIESKVTTLELKD